MPIDYGDLEKPEKREVINPTASDLSVKTPGAIEKGAEEITKIIPLSRRDFLKAGGILALGGVAYLLREPLASLFNEVKKTKFEEKEEEKPPDQRIIDAFKENYPAEAREQAIGQYSLYLLGNNDAAFNLTNTPEQGEKDNIVWYLTYEYGATWPFASPERDQKTLDPTEDTTKRLFNVASKETFIDKISTDLELTTEQKSDLISRYDSLSPRKPDVSATVSSAAMVQWLTDLKNQGVEKITDEVIQFYTDPVKVVTGLSQ